MLENGRNTGKNYFAKKKSIGKSINMVKKDLIFL